jgi:class 3 adenylate cyclase
MRLPSGLGERLEPLLSIGADPGESETERGGRRVVIAATVIASVLSAPSAVADLIAGYTWVGVMNLALVAAAAAALGVIAARPRLLRPAITLLFANVFVGALVETTLFGGLVESGLAPIFGLILVLGSLLVFGMRTAMVWFAAFVGSVAFSLVVPDLVQPVYTIDDPSGDVAFNVVALGVVTVAVLAYFVHQRDRFQRRSDDLLRNVLPDDVVARLKDDHTKIADDISSASVLFADVVGFTPMSAAMTPAELVDLLDDVFTTFDGFASELGLEKIKTIGDAYMVAAGVPTPRSDHADAIAELAIRMRDHIASTSLRGRRLALRIGIDSGPLTAGVIGTHRFAYDLWGDTVNTASRMESGAPPGSIQVTPATRALIGERFVCEPRGRIDVKGKGPMDTFLLVSRRSDDRAPVSR